MKVLITGAAGFIGSVLARRLLERGGEVRGLLLPGEPDRGLGAAGMEVVRGDLTDAAGIMGRDNDVSNQRAVNELGWSTRVPWEEAWTAITAWVREVYLLST